MSKASEMAEAMRKMADDIESGAVPMPYDISVNVFWAVTDNGSVGEQFTTEDARRAMDATPGGWDKTYTDAYVTYQKEYGDRVSYDLNLNRGVVCQKVQTGVRHVPATPERNEPIFEWVCE